MEYSKLVDQVGQGWADFLKPFMCPGDDGTCPYDKIVEKLKEAYGATGTTVVPDKKLIFRAFRETPLENLRVVFLGVEPYLRVGYANGLAYATDAKDMLPPPLVAMYEGLEKDAYNGMDLIGHATRGGTLQHTPTSPTWMEQGVLMLNLSLTGEAKKPLAHMDIWQPFYEFVISNLWRYKRDLIFIGLGEQAKEALRYNHTGKDMFGKDGNGESKGVNVFLGFVVHGEHPTEAIKAERKWTTDVFSRTNLIIRINHLGPEIEW